MRAGIVSSSQITGHRWTSMTPAAHLGDIERSQEEYNKAAQHLKNAQARFKRAQQRLDAANEESTRLLREGKVIPISIAKDRIDG